MERIDLAFKAGAQSRDETVRTPMVIEERDPERFVQAFARAAAQSGSVFLSDPQWGEAERAELSGILRSQQSRGGTDNEHRGWLMIPSGGSAGHLKFARHDHQTIAAAVQGFCAYTGLESVNAVGLLPLYHVSGFMAWMRCVLTGGEYLGWKWKDLEEGRFSPVPPNACLSIVPTQLQRLLDSEPAIEWLRRFKFLFVGGGPLWPTLADRAGKLSLPISLTYGLTETAAMVAALPAKDFIAGGRGCGAPMPHARIDLTSDGLVRIAGESLFLGYYPDWRPSEPLVTEDLGHFDKQGHLHILGRRDSVIITGGKKVDPLEVEATLRATGEFDDVAVIGYPDPEWGQRVLACYPSGRQPDPERIAKVLIRLSPHKSPRRYVEISPWPRNAQGKVNRAELVRQVAKQFPEG